MGRERYSFIGQTNKDPETFLKKANLTPIEIPKDVPTKDRPLYIFNRYLELLEDRTSYISVSRTGRPPTFYVDDSDNIKREYPELFWVIEDNQEEFLKSARDMLTVGPFDNDISFFTEQLDLRDFFRSLILVTLSSGVHHSTVDGETGIRIVQLNNQTAFPMHPTPAH